MAIKVKKSSTVSSNENTTSSSASAKPETKAAPKAAAAAKSAEPKAKKEKSENKRFTKSNMFNDRILFGAELCAKQKLTDAEIIEKINAQFPDYPGIKFTQKEMGRIRWMNKCNRISGFDNKGKCLSPVFEIDGKRYAKADRPKKAATKKAKIDPAKDPLNNIAGINANAKKAASAINDKPKADASAEATAASAKKAKVKRSA